MNRLDGAVAPARASAWRRWLPAGLRTALFVALAALVWVLLRSEKGGEPATAAATQAWVWRWPGAAALLAQRLGEPLFRTDTLPPDAGELDALAAAAERGPLVAALPAGGAVRLQAAPPEHARAGWPAALPIQVHGPPGEAIQVKLVGAAGVEDSLRVLLPATGQAEAAFRVVPGRAGWADWHVIAGRAEQRVGARVAPPDSLRVLLVAGPPSWESKFVARALEEAGLATAVVQPLAPGVDVGGEPARLPAAAAGLAPFHAVLLLHGAEVGPAQRTALREFAAAGGGVLHVGTVAVAPGRSAPGRSTEVSARALQWSLPADLAPLPPASFPVAVEPLGPLPPGARVVGAAADQPLLVLQSFGRGRLASLALTQSWRWRMEAGRVEAHRDFWLSLARWLASGRPTAAVLRLAPSVGVAGQPVDVALHAAPDAPPPPAVLLRHPSGTRELLPLRPDAARAGVLRARFVPAETGVYEVHAGGADAAGFRAMEGRVPDTAPWARLAQLAHRSGGRLVPADSVPVLLGQAGSGSGRAAPASWLPLLFGLVLAAALLEWGVRRATGRR